jgi:hypothetical protein
VYVLGIVKDRVADRLFAYCDKPLRWDEFKDDAGYHRARTYVSACGTEEISSLFKYHRHRSKFCRAWTVNFALLAITTPIFAWVRRRHNKIATVVSADLDELEAGLWKRTMQTGSGLGPQGSPADEREVAEFIDDHFKGCGPKQSRNLLQWLALAKYELPLDSRITKWLNEFGFPVELSAGALSDRNYYSFVSDGVQARCAQSDIYPCVLHAPIFTSFDRGEWTEDQLVY